MTDSNRLQLTAVVESTIGTTPNTPRMRKMRTTGESLRFAPAFVNSDEIRDDRMNADPIKVGETNDGGINFELHYPVPDSILSSAIESAFLSAWVNTPTRDNDGTPDSVITQVTAASDTFTFTTGTAFVEGQLVKASGFTNAGNNGIFRAEESATGATALKVPASPGLTDEAAPPAAARLKVIGARGETGDIQATSGGLSCTALSFTAVGIVPGMWIKVGGTNSANKFATAACNGWIRVTAVTATSITADNLPSGWTTDNGSGKDISLFFGDYIKNGTTKKALSVERGFLGQQTPTYVVQTGMIVNQLQMAWNAKQKLTGSFAFMGLGGSESTTPLDASPDAAPSISSYGVMAAGVNVGRVAENGSQLTDPNWVRNLTFTLNNNLRMLDAVDSVASVGHGVGECAVTVTAETYFGSRALYTKLLAGTVTSMNGRATKNSQALIVDFPRLTMTEGSPNASAKNTDVMLPLTLMASLDETTNAHILLNRVEYFE